MCFEDKLSLRDSKAGRSASRCRNLNDVFEALNFFISSGTRPKTADVRLWIKASKRSIVQISSEGLK